VSRNKIPETIQAQVRQRARYLCEFCHADEMWQYVRFNVDHVMPLSLGGDDLWSDGFGVTSGRLRQRLPTARYAIDLLQRPIFVRVAYRR
jgi:hypothetical protein